jgi:hypothetical protein
LHKLFDTNPIAKLYPIMGTPVDYFDFPENLYAFATGAPGSQLHINHCGAIFRERKSSMTLLTWDCSNEKLLQIINSYKRPGRAIKSLSYVNKDFSLLTKKRGKPEYKMYGTYDELLSEMKKKERYEVKKGFTLYEIVPRPKKVEVLELMEKWKEWASTRLFMLHTGHHMSFIRNYYEHNTKNTYIYGYRRINSDTLIGVTGFEICKDKAVVVVLKHSKDHYCTPYFEWGMTIKLIQEINPNVREIFAGSSTDAVKSRLMFKPEPSYKLNFGEKKE